MAAMLVRSKLHLVPCTLPSTKQTLMTKFTNIYDSFNYKPNFKILINVKISNCIITLKIVCLYNYIFLKVNSEN